METANFWRRTHRVEAVRLTETNARNIAEECGGVFYPDKMSRVTHISIEDSIAFVGDWVSFRDLVDCKIYTDEEFVRKFQALPEVLSSDERYAKIFQLVMSAMSKQDVTTYHGEINAGMDLVAFETTKQILESI